MEQSFNSKIFVQELADDLADSFTKANKATTPTLVGAAKEKAVRKKLELLLPSVAGVGTGCVIDSYGQTSKQCDIVIYEKNFCPVFSINDNPETTYFPCESVIAVGEIKSTLDSKELFDSFAKIESVKKLKRYFESTPVNSQTIGGYDFRKYGSQLVFTGTFEERFDQENNFADQIYGFILAERTSLKIETFLQKYTELVKNNIASLLPNVTFSLNDGLFLYMNKIEYKIYPSKLNSTVIQNIKTSSNNFQYLLTRLADIIYSGRTTNVMPFQRYIQETNYLTADDLFQEL